METVDDVCAGLVCVCACVCLGDGGKYSKCSGGRIALDPKI